MQELETLNNQSIIRLTEISATDFPVSNSYKYKCRVQVISHEGETSLEKELFVRMQPNWLVDLKNQGDCTIAITLCYREGDITHPWQDAGTVTFTTEDCLKGERNADLEFPITTWEQAPELKLKARLTQSSSETISNTITVFSKQNSSRRRTQGTAEKAEFELPQPTILTPPEEVIVKDVWNKLRAWKELQMEKFFKRLLLEEPELEYLFGEAIDSMSDFFYELFDCAIHQLQPETQIILAEPLTGVPPEQEHGFKTVAEYGSFFADTGMRPQHWLKARQVWMWMLPSTAYLEEYDREDLSKSENSALYKFFTTHIILPMVEAIHHYEAALPPETLKEMAACWEVFSQNKQQMGMEFYQILFEKYPFVLPIFGRADMDYLSLHLFQALEFLVRCLKTGSSDEMLQELRFLGQVHSFADVPSCAYSAISDTLFILFDRYLPNFTPELRQGWQILLDRVVNVVKMPMINQERLLKKAKQFLNVIASEQAWEAEDKERRWKEIKEEVKATGTYTHSYEELAYGTQVAWRNASKCVGRIAWNNMVVRDRRHVTDPDEMFRECQEHVKFATNGGNLQITMTVFRPKQPKERWGVRFWNSQLYRYAAYQQPDGSILGDPANLDLTKAIIKLGWQPPQPPTAYDILPVVIEVPGQAPKMYHWEPEEVLEVHIEHPTIPEFKALGMRWYAIPAISNFSVHVGGIHYGCMPFNGWYMDTEIMRDFLDEYRYNKMEEIAQVLKLDTSSEQTLWRDRVALELNTAILYSFQQAKVTMVDHQTASRQFMTHDLREKKAGRECPAEWAWVVPATGGSICPVWHHSMRDFYLEPAYHHAADRWAVEDGLDLEKLAVVADEDGNKQDRILILYASETGTAEGFARKAARQLNRYRPQVMALDEYNTNNLASEKLLLVVTSTFGNGEMPSKGKRFLQWLQQQPKGSLQGLNYSVLGIGSTVYEQFCAAAISVDKALAKAGANCIVPIHKGDEIKGQAETFKQWLGLVSRVMGEDATSGNTATSTPKLAVTFLEEAILPLSAREGGIPVPVVANQELLQEVIAGSRSTRFIALDLSNTDLQYETGDHVAVHPCNPPELVQRLCDRLNLNPHAYFTAQYVTSSGESLEDQPPIAVPSTVHQVFSEDLDLGLRAPFTELLAYLYSTVENPQEKYRLETWLEILRQGDENPDSIALKKNLTDNFISVVDLLEEFPSAPIELGILLELLPKQKPRLYSISSCPLLHPRQIQITVGVLQIKTDAGKVRQGLCSNYLAGLQPGSSVRIGVITSAFRPPADSQSPILMVGPGTGVSPLIAFLQHREALQNQGVPLGEASLYFGCRNHSDFIYQEPLQTWQNQGVLTELNVAFSRLGEQKQYVQNLMEQQPEKIWKILSHPQCHYYVCGDAKMADDVFAVMMNIAKKQGQLTHAEMVEFFDRMKQEKRFFTDVWGVQLHFKQAIEEVQKNNYSKAALWLNRIKDSVDAYKPESNPIFYEALQKHFPGALPMPVYMQITYETLGDYGFENKNTMGMTTLCRDEITEPFLTEVVRKWGNSFNCSSLAGFVMMGKTAVAAATDHVPIVGDKRRFAFYAMPHIAISKDGEVGKVYRYGIQKVSHACGALEAIAKELLSGKLMLEMDMQDVEQTIIRQKILSNIHYGDKPNLIEITKLASQIISKDIQSLFSVVDPSMFEYAVMTGIQIHGPMDTNWIYPLEFYVVGQDIAGGKEEIPVFKEMQTQEDEMMLTSVG
ncbi:nitric oxide synthase oxygenase [Laspinema palackyanum]|uniref:nitric oxide synthase oxygenase n=1 Tax=Laspinema palackyanum TaxID=3231601 RepID=UPI00345D4238|nr:nitric oxide synthase oxygenase [Laspinema sp. D2c]